MKKVTILPKMYRASLYVVVGTAYVRGNVKMEYEIFHRYRALADAGKVIPWRCPEDGYELILKARGKDYAPVLHCYWCGTTTIPGTDMYERMVREISEAQD